MDDPTGYDWHAIAKTLDARGWARLPKLLDPAHCIALAALYDEGRLFRSTVTMERHGFGRGEYRYFAYPLPSAIAALRTALYRQLAPVANGWAAAEGRGERYPAEHEAYLERCRAMGQDRPTPLLLRYAAGDFNRLHQDVYGAESFPLQVAILLSQPEEHFTGGQFILTEQRPRMQSRVESVALRQGDGVVFAVSHRPVAGSRGYYRANMRHGVTTVESGCRSCLGIIFHDAA